VSYEHSLEHGLMLSFFFLLVNFFLNIYVHINLKCYSQGIVGFGIGLAAMVSPRGYNNSLVLPTNLTTV